MTIKTIDHNKFIDRIYDILTQDAELIKKINKKNIIKYNPPSPKSAGLGVALPYIYITEAPNPVIQEKVVGRGNPPIQMLSLQYWVVIAVQSTKGANTQKTLTEYLQILERIFNEHPYLQNISNDLGVRRVRCKSVDRSEGAIGKPRQAKNLMVTVDVMYTPTNAPFSINFLTGERSHTLDPAAALEIINDGNDGSLQPAITPISVANLNDGDKTTYVEIPPGATLTFNDTQSFFSSGYTIWAFFQGLPNAKIIIRLHNSNGTVSWESNEVGPNANNDAINTGVTSRTTYRATQSIENTGTETAYYAGWVGKNDGTVPTDTGGRNFSNGAIRQQETRPFTSIPIFLGDTAEIIPIQDEVIFNPYFPLRIYVNKDADAEFEITIIYTSYPEPTTRVYNVSSVDGLIQIVDDTLGVGAGRISIKPTKITGATSIDLAGMRYAVQDGTIEGNYAVVKVLSIVAATDSEFPFDHNIDTSVGLAVGIYFFKQFGKKELDSIIVSSQDGGALSVTVSTSMDGITYKQEGVIFIEDSLPITYNFDKTFQDLSFVKFVANKRFRLHELNVLGQT